MRLPVFFGVRTARGGEAGCGNDGLGFGFLGF